MSSSNELSYSLLDLLSLLGSLGVFIYGMKVMSESIQKIAGKSLRKLLSTLTNNRFSGWLTGFITTSLIQSSSATTVMVVSFVNAGLLTVAQSIGVIMGANFGTTVTSWLISLLGFGKFHITSYALPLIAIAVPLLFSKLKRRNSFGEFLLGFGLLFIGLDFMKDCVPDLKNNPEVLAFLSEYSSMGMLSTILFVIIGSILTVVVQSSSAAMSITLVMVAQGWVPIQVGIGMVLGENIGTTITAYLASLIGNVNAKRAARAHMVFNLIGVFWMILILPWFTNWMDSLNQFFFGYKSVFTNDLEARGDAMPKALSLFHSCFNFLNAVLLIGFVPQIEKLVNKMVKDKHETKTAKFIDYSIVTTPELAILEAKKEIDSYAKKVFEMMQNVHILLDKDIKKKEPIFDEIELMEKESDELELEICEFLSSLSTERISQETSDRTFQLTAITHELESSADLCYRMSLTIDQNETNEITLEKSLNKQVMEMFDLLYQAFEVAKKNLEKLEEGIDYNLALELEEKINAKREEMRTHLLERKEKKATKIKSGLLFRDIFNLQERLGDKLYEISKIIQGV